ncbi:MAG: heavy-metal-associated domain-containing protein [Chloroflexota bacterium]
MPTLHLIAPDISCDHCKATIERELGGMTGVDHVTVEVPSKRVDVSFDRSAVDEDAILAKLDDEGYPATQWSEVS